MLSFFCDLMLGIFVFLQTGDLAVTLPKEAEVRFFAGHDTLDILDMLEIDDGGDDSEQHGAEDLARGEPIQNGERRGACHRDDADVIH